MYEKEQLELQQKLEEMEDKNKQSAGNAREKQKLLKDKKKLLDDISDSQSMKKMPTKTVADSDAQIRILGTKK